MLIKSRIAVAAALVLGAASVAMAADDDQRGGFRELPNGGSAQQGVNPADHPSLGGASAAAPKVMPAPQTEGRGPATTPSRKPQDNYGSEATKQ